jgi:hypothetical protein
VTALADALFLGIAFLALFCLAVALWNHRLDRREYNRLFCRLMDAKDLDGPDGQAWKFVRSVLLQEAK